MYDIRVNNGDSTIIIYDWKIPKNAIYNAAPEEPFICLRPSEWNYDSFIWLYTEQGWHFESPPIRLREQLFDFIVTNHLGRPKGPLKTLPRSNNKEKSTACKSNNKEKSTAYNIKVNNGNSPVIIYGWEIPKNAVYCDDPKDPFVCLFPSPQFYNTYVWRYKTVGSMGRWNRNMLPRQTKECLLDFIVKNQLECSCAIEGSPPPWCENGSYNLKVNKGNKPVIIHGWEIPKNAVYNAGPKAPPFVCLSPSKSSYFSNIWWYDKNASGNRWQHNKAPEGIKVALFDFIDSNHLDCSHVIEGSPPGTRGGVYNIKINNGNSPLIIHGWEVPKNAAYNADPKDSFVCLHPSLEFYESSIWWYHKNKSGNGWQHKNPPTRIKKALHDFIAGDQLSSIHVDKINRPTRKQQRKKRNPQEERAPKACIVCGQPTFMGTQYCYNCYHQYVEQRKR